MKFSLGFSAMALAADSQAPVISLDLSQQLCAHDDAASGRLCPNTAGYTQGDSNIARSMTTDGDLYSYADTCESHKNTPGANCSEPEATAVDHHNSNILVTTSYILWVRALAMSDVEKCTAAAAATSTCFGEAEVTAINFETRGEWVVKYTAEDASGNAAETLTFALIIEDTEAPIITTATIRTAAADSPIELCDTTFDLVLFGTIASVDAVDGNLDQFNSDFQYSGTAGGVSVLSCYRNGSCGLDSSWAVALMQKSGVDVSLSSSDFASIFGTSNVNNVQTYTDTIWFNDSTNPVVNDVPVHDNAECGELFFPNDATYSDCYDDWAASKSGRGKNTVTKSVTGAVDLQNYVAGTGYLVQCDVASGCNIKIEYDVVDHFNNAGTAEVNVPALDTLKPTLFVTQLVPQGTTETMANGDICVRKTSERSWTEEASPNYAHHYWEHCENVAHLDGFMTYAHVTDSTAEVTEYDPALDATEIQHSAGMEGTYDVISSLITQGTGYSCTDKCGAGLTVTAIWASDCAGTAGTAWDNSVTGTYYIYYSCNDTPGNTLTACRTIFNIDKTKPVITVLSQSNTLEGTLSIEADLSSNYVDFGASCSDVVDGVISDQVEVSGDVVNLGVPETYYITYNCEDTAGNAARTNYRTVVISDSTCPFCSYDAGDLTMPGTIEASFPYTAANVTCTDTIEGELAVNPTCVTGCANGEPDVEKPGTYVLTWSSTDSYGNGASDENVHGVACDSNMITLTQVVEDSLPPTILLDYKNTRIHGPARLMVESQANGWVVGAVASAVSGIALLGYAATRKNAAVSTVPV